VLLSRFAPRQSINPLSVRQTDVTDVITEIIIDLSSSTKTALHFAAAVENGDRRISENQSSTQLK
jgi:hypothetical protein